MFAANRVRHRLFTSLVILVDPLLTLISSGLHMNFAASGFMHLLLVLTVALHLGFWPATIVSVVANLGLNFYLVPPAHSLLVSDPQNLVALIVFEICALIVSRLSAHAHLQETLAISHRLELEKLCSFSRRLLLLNRNDKPGRQIVQIIHDEFATDCALFFDGATASHQSVITPDTPIEKLTQMEASVRAAYFQNRDSSDLANHQFVTRVMRLGAIPTGAIGLQGSSITAFLATAISLLCAIALEREKSLDREANQAAEQKGEQLRVAVLDALAHEYKTPLTVIRTATGGLLEIGDLGALQSDLVQLIDLQTCRLDSLTTQLLQTARIDGPHPDIKPTLIEVEELLSSLTHLMASTLSDHPIQISIGENCTQITTDRQLLITALMQYLENAAKYSSPASPIAVTVESDHRCLTIGVHNHGSYIPHIERERIFDRFHRMPSGFHSVSGTGIGLSIVRKVAAALHGKAWVASDQVAGTTFYFSIPINPRRT